MNPVLESTSLLEVEFLTRYRGLGSDGWGRHRTHGERQPKVPYAGGLSALFHFGDRRGDPFELLENLIPLSKASTGVQSSKVIRRDSTDGRSR